MALRQGGRPKTGLRGGELRRYRAVRDVGTRAARHALSVLPRAFEFSISMALHAVERVLDRGRGFELGR